MNETELVLEFKTTWLNCFQFGYPVMCSCDIIGWVQFMYYVQLKIKNEPENNIFMLSCNKNLEQLKSVSIVVFIKKI